VLQPPLLLLLAKTECARLVCSDDRSDASFDDSKWSGCRKADEFSTSPYKITWQPMPAIRALEMNAPLSITPIKYETGETSYVFKFPQNAAGWAKLSVHGCKAGTAITMFFSENLCGYGPTRWSPSCVAAGKPFGSVDQRNYHGDW
jgi:hypothetical protein